MVFLGFGKAFLLILDTLTALSLSLHFPLVTIGIDSFGDNRHRFFYGRDAYIVPPLPSISLGSFLILYLSDIVSLSSPLDGVSLPILVVFS